MTGRAFLAVALAWPLLAGPAQSAAPSQAPMLDQAVREGALPPVHERLPEVPAVAPLDGPGQSLGRYGGRLNTLMARAKDIRMMMVYGYARLVGYDRELELVPDLLRKVEVEAERSFTFHLRPNHRWSDGHPFTAEDFRYYWEDVVNNEELSLFGPPKDLLVDGRPPRFEVIDPLTVRYTWGDPNPSFLPALAAARPLFIYRPAHYLKQFHARYADPQALKARIVAASARNWAGLHHAMDQQYNFDNVELPTLQPWRNTTAPPSERFVFVRNPYYHRVDGAGRQLPYIDEIVVSIVDSSLIPAKTGFGESDLQARYIHFDDYTFLKKGEKERGYGVRLWQTASGSEVALFPNLNAQDKTWRALLRDARFRRALSLAIHRHAVNQVLYFGLGQPSANTVLPASPLFRPAYRTAWAEHDPDAANALLDEIGLTRRNGAGTRLLPDGRPLQIIVDTAGESTEESDVLELIKEDWRAIGVELFTKPSQREVFRNRVFAGGAIMSVWSGLENARPTAAMTPAELAPTAQTQLQWPKWGEHYETSGASGEAPDMAVARELLDLLKAWRFAASRAEREEIWHAMLRINAEQVFSIGTVNGVPQPIVVNDRLRNVPAEGVFNWDPGAYFGIYRPDTFWFDEPRQAAR